MFEALKLWSDLWRLGCTSSGSLGSKPPNSGVVGLAIGQPKTLDSPVIHRYYQSSRQPRPQCNFLLHRHQLLTYQSQAAWASRWKISQSQLLYVDGAYTSFRMNTKPFDLQTQSQ